MSGGVWRRDGVGPGRIAAGAGLGAVAGYVLHNESTLAWQRLNIRRAYRDRLKYQLERDRAGGFEKHPPLK